MSFDINCNVTTKISEISKLFIDGSNSISLNNELPIKDKLGDTIGNLLFSFDIKKQSETNLVNADIVKAQAKQIAALQGKVHALEAELDENKLYAASIVHELRTYLAIMDLNYGVLKRVLPTLLTAYGKAVGVKLVDKDINLVDIDTLEFQLQEIPGALNELRVFVDMMLMHINHQVMKPKCEQLSMNEAITEVINHYPFKEHELGLVDFQYEKHSNYCFNGDKIMFKHIMFNLIKNALHFIKASNKKGAEIKIWLEPGDKFNVLNFRDNGAGIPSDILPNIFKPFYSKRQGGTGVGLALCKNFMEKLEGDISCHSSEGDYTQFTLRFPKI